MTRADEVFALVERVQFAHYKTVDARGALGLMKEDDARRAMARVRLDEGYKEHQAALEALEKYVLEVATEVADKQGRDEEKVESYAKEIIDLMAERDGLQALLLKEKTYTTYARVPVMTDAVHEELETLRRENEILRRENGRS
jgi:hypothetical protein